MNPIYQEQCKTILIFLSLTCAFFFSTMFIIDSSKKEFKDDGIKFLKSFLSFKDSTVNQTLVVRNRSLKNLSLRWPNMSNDDVEGNWSANTEFAAFSNTTIEERFLIDPYRLCEGNISVIIVVPSASNQRYERQFLRNEAPLPLHWKRIFFIGHAIRNANHMTRCTQTSLQLQHCEIDQDIDQAVMKESREMNDILFGDFYDVYQNLTIKTILMLRWTTTRCPNARYLMKIDDDIVPNIYYLEKLLDQWNKENREKKPMGGNHNDLSSFT